MSTSPTQPVEMAYLRIPLSLLQWEDPGAFQGLSPERVRRFAEEYEPDEAAGILAAIRAVLVLGDDALTRFDFTPWLPDGVVSDNLTLRSFLANVYGSLTGVWPGPG